MKTKWDWSLAEWRDYYEGLRIKAYNNYQECGENRYDREHHKYPFCGGAVRFNHALTGEPTSVWCNQCHALTIFSRVKTDHSRPFGEIMDEIAVAWNRRTNNDNDQML